MKNLDALCCDGCRAKVAAIEGRDQASGEGWFAGSWEGQPAAFTAHAVSDRRELLAMLEQLLGTVAKQREDAKTLSEPIQQWLKIEAQRLLNNVPPGAE